MEEEETGPLAGLVVFPELGRDRQAGRGPSRGFYPGSWELLLLHPLGFCFSWTTGWLALLNCLFVAKGVLYALELPLSLSLTRLLPALSQIMSFDPTRSLFSCEGVLGSAHMKVYVFLLAARTFSSQPLIRGDLPKTIRGFLSRNVYVLRA